MLWEYFSLWKYFCGIKIKLTKLKIKKILKYYWYYFIASSDTKF